jgi:hypothetical protein
MEKDSSGMSFYFKIKGHRKSFTEFKFSANKKKVKPRKQAPMTKQTAEGQGDNKTTLKKMNTTTKK